MSSPVILGQLLGNGRSGSLRSLYASPHLFTHRLRDPLRSHRRTQRGVAGQQGRSERDRDLEPGVHAVLARRERQAAPASRAPRGHGHGFRAPDVHSAGQDVELRHGRVHADLRGDPPRGGRGSVHGSGGGSERRGQERRGGEEGHGVCSFY